MKTDAQWLDRFVKMEEKWKKDAGGWLDYMEVRVHSCDALVHSFELSAHVFFASCSFPSDAGQVSKGKKSHKRHHQLHQLFCQRRNCLVSN
jgi:hypothetical protein